MFAKHLIDKVLLTLEVGEQTPLFILLANDGTINRKGNGDVNADLPLLMGISHDKHFEALMMTVNEGIFDHAGVLKFPNRLGTECRLTLIFQGKNELDYSFRVVYGEQSEGPPIELSQILINAVKITEPWYQANLNTAGEQKQEEKWWQFWK